MKRFIIVLLLGLLVLIGTVSCANHDKEANKPSAKNKIITENNSKEFFDKPSSYIGYTIDVTAVVDESKYEKGKGVVSNVLMFPESYSGAILLVDKKGEKKLIQQSTIEISGEVVSVIERNNKFGKKEKLPEVVVSTINSVDSASKKEKVLKSVAVNSSKEKELIYATVEKVQILKDSTRVSIFLYNKSGNRIYFNDSKLELKADHQLVTAKYEVLDKKKRLKRSLEINQGSHGILSFSKIPTNTKKLALVLNLNTVDSKKNVKLSFDINMVDGKSNGEQIVKVSKK